jgi:hypothetical protein
VQAPSDDALRRLYRGKRYVEDLTHDLQAEPIGELNFLQ